MERSVRGFRLYTLLRADARKPLKYKLPVDTNVPAVKPKRRDGATAVCDSNRRKDKANGNAVSHRITQSLTQKCVF